MISRLLSLIVLLPLAVLLVVFCVVNREPVTLSLDALGTTPQLALQAPLFVVILLAVILGTVLGGFGTWIGQSHYRSRAARRAREVESLRHEVAASNERMRAMREERERERTALPRVSAAPSQPALAAPAAA